MERTGNTYTIPAVDGPSAVTNFVVRPMFRLVGKRRYLVARLVNDDGVESDPVVFAPRELIHVGFFAQKCRAQGPFLCFRVYRMTGIRALINAESVPEVRLPE